MPEQNTTTKTVKFFVTQFDLLTPCWESPASAACTVATIVGVTSGCVLPPLMLIGIPGCLAIPIVFRRMSNGKLTRQQFYLTALSLIDLLSIVVNGVVWQFLAKGLPWVTRGSWYFIVLNQSRGICVASRGMSALSSSLASSFLLLPCTDRLLAVTRPLKYAGVGVSSAKVATVAFLTIFGTLSSTYFFTSDWVFIELTDSTLVFCSTTVGLSQKVGAVVQLLRFIFTTVGVVHPVLLTALNALLMVFIVKAMRCRSRMQGAASDSDLSLNEIRASVTLVTLSVLQLVPSCLFVTFTLAAHLQPQFSMKSRQFLFQIGNIGVVLFVCQECLSIFVYIVRMPDFRRELKRLFLRRQPQDQSG